MKLHSVGWFCAICWQAVITLSGFYFTVPSEMKREERGVEAESGRSQRTNGAGDILSSRPPFTAARPEMVSRVHGVNLVSSLLFKCGYQHEHCKCKGIQ